MGMLLNGIGSMTGTRSAAPAPPPPPPAIAGEAGVTGSPRLANGAWDDGPKGYYGPKGPGYGLKEGETMTIDPSSDNALGPKSLSDKALTATSNFLQGKGFDTRTSPMPKLTFVGTKDPFAPKVYREGDPGFVDYSRGTKTVGGAKIGMPGGSAFDQNGNARPDAFVKFPDSAFGYKGNAFGYSWDMTPFVPQQTMMSAPPQVRAAQGQQ